MSPVDPPCPDSEESLWLFCATIPPHIRGEFKVSCGDDGRVSTTLVHMVSSLYIGIAMAIIMAAMAITMTISTTVKRVFRMILFIVNSSLPVAIFLVLLFGNPV